MLISGPLHTLKQGQRSRVLGTADPGENGEDESKAWQNERMAFSKENKRSYFSFCPNWTFLLSVKWLLRVHQRGTLKSTVFPTCFIFLDLFYFHSQRTGFRHVSPHFWEQLCISNPYKTTRSARRWCSAWRSSIFTSSRMEVWWGRPCGARDDKPSLQSASSGEAAPSSPIFQVENMMLCLSTEEKDCSPRISRRRGTRSPAAALRPKEKRTPRSQWTAVASGPVWEGLGKVGPVYQDIISQWL